MERQKVVREKASHVAEIGYDSATQKLEVAFTSGAAYEYFKVPQSLYDEFVKADSLGSFVATRIRGAFEYKRLHAENCTPEAKDGCSCQNCWCHKLTATSRETEKPHEEKAAKPAKTKKLRTGI